MISAKPPYDLGTSLPMISAHACVVRQPERVRVGGPPREALALPPVLALGLALALAASLGLPRCSPIKKMPFVRCAR